MHQDTNPLKIPTPYDIAIIKLKTPVTFTPSLYPICIPKAKENFRGSNAIAAGWGKDQSGRTSDALKEATVMILNSTDECAYAWKDVQGVQVCKL